MKQFFLDKSMNFICYYQCFSDYERKKLKYGLEGLYLTISKMMVLIVLSIIFHMFFEFLLVVLFFNIIRYTGFGFHAEKSYHCLFFSIFNFIFLPFFLLHIQLSTFFVFIICGFCILHYLFFAPADTKNRPLSNKRKRLIRKILTIMIGLVYSTNIIVFDNQYWRVIILSALIIQMIVVSPLTYRMFGQTFNNYKKLNTLS